MTPWCGFIKTRCCPCYKSVYDVPVEQEMALHYKELEEEPGEVAVDEGNYVSLSQPGCSTVILTK